MSGIDSMTEFYVYENMQLLEQLEEILLSGQSDTGELSQEEIEEIFRAMHTIKGSRSEERRVGKECRIGCRSRWSPYH